MNCQEFEKYLMKGSPLTAESHEHMKTCATCRASYESLSQVDAYLDKLMSRDLPDDFDGRVMQALESNTEAPLIPLKPHLLRRSIAASIAVLVAVGLGVALGSYSSKLYKQAGVYADNQLFIDAGMQQNDNAFDLVSLGK